MSEKIPVFLSYARADDEAFVRKLYNDLERVGFAPWYDKENMTNDGSPFTQAIGDAIRRSQRVLFVVGPRSVESKYCRGEWSLAQELCIPVVPLLRLGEYESIPAAIGSGHAINCRESRDYGEMLVEIDRILKEPVPDLCPIPTVPSLPKAFINRPQYIDPLKEAINSGDRLLALTSKQEATALVGIGGIGKTTLASALCHDCEVRRTFNQIFWVNAGPDRGKNEVAEMMRVTVNGAAEAYDSYENARNSFAQVLHGKKTLLIVDDIWQEGVAEAFQFSGVECSLLLTTRLKRLLEALHIRGEEVDQLGDDEALALISEVAEREFSADDADLAAILTMLSGHALALTLAGAWLRKHKSKSTADLHHRLQTRPDFRDLKLAETDKNKNLELALRLSYDDLTEEARGHFRELGVLAKNAPVDEKLLAALWGIEDEIDAEDALDALLDAGLLSRDKENDNAYRLHPLLNAYARALMSDDERDTAFRRYAEHVTEQARQFRTLKPEEWGALDGLLPHVDFVGDELVTLWDALTPQPPLPNAALGEGGQSAPETNPPDDTRSPSSLPTDTVGADHDPPEQSPSPLVGEGDTGGEGAALTTLASNFAYNVKNYVFRRPQAVQTADGTRLRGMNWLEMGLSASRAQGNKGRASLFLNQIAIAYQNIGEGRKAIDYFEKTISIDRELEDQFGEATTLTNIGAVWSALGEKHKALEYYQQALPILRDVGNRSVEATTLNNIGRVWDDLGEKHRALDYYQQALPLFQAVGVRSGEATTLNNMAAIYYHEGNLEKAAETFEEIIEIVRKMGAVASEALYLYNIAVVYQRMGRIEDAIQSAEAGRVILVKYNLPQNAGGGTLAHYDALLAKLRGE